MTLLPGLVDSHQHLCFNGIGTLEEQVRGVTDEELLARARAAAQLALSAGITTVRDLGDRNFVTLGLRDDPALPTLLSAGPPITVPDGHCWYLGGECDSDDALRNAIAERADRACDAVKIMVSGGALTPTFPPWKSQFDEAQMRTMVDEAHKRSLPVAAHCHGVEAIETSIRVGVDSIEHCTFITEEQRSEPTDELEHALATSGIAVSCTVGAKPDAEPPPLVKQNLGAVRAAYVRVHELGGRLVAGSDAGIAIHKLHDDLRYTCAEMVAVGMPTEDVLRMLTSAGADSLGLAHRKGRLRRGLDADVLAIAGDPRDDPLALLATAAVWCRGERMR